MGSMDLDLRPPPMRRNTLGQQIHQCDACGYCSVDLENAEGTERETVQSAAYQAIVTDPRYPPLARRFLAYAHLAANTDNDQRIAWSMLRAAWACDDEGLAYVHGSSQCRDHVVAALDRLHAEDDSFTKDPQSDDILRLDLLRRAGHFEATIAAATQLRMTSLPDTLDQIAAFQIVQAGKQNRDCFTVEAALADSRSQE
jgi:hypothetical protein